MSDRVNVVEDGLTTTRPGRPTRPSRPSWIQGAVGFALGLGLGVLVVSPGGDLPEDAPVPTTVAVAEPTVTSTLPIEREPGLAEVVDGFPDALVAIARTTSTSLDHVLWPHRGEVRVRSMTGGEHIVLDVGSQFIAFSDRVPGLSGSLLSMGRFNSIQPVASHVTSYTWHDSEPARLAYTQDAGQGALLFTVKADLNPVLVGEIEDGSEVAAWGDWGWAIQQSGTILLLSPDGAFKDTEVGTAYASHGTGWVFAMEGDEAKLVSAGGGVRRIQAPLGVGAIRRAAFSPDGTRVAVVGATGVVVVDVETQEIGQLTEFTSTSVAWSTDSRFVAIAAPSGLLVVDLEEPVVGYRVLTDHSALAVGVLRLRSS